jgi:hypothetical protein
MAEAPEIRVTDSKARLTLPRNFANSTLLLEIRGNNEIVIRKAKVVPLADPEEGAVTISLSDRDWEAFAAALENPPEPNDALRKLMRQSPPRKKKTTKKRAE